MAQSVLEVENLWVKKGRHILLEDVSFAVGPSELVAIVGPNGAGKTTLLRALSGERPAAGRVLIEGESLYDDPERLLAKVGYLPADLFLHRTLTVHQALSYMRQLFAPAEPLGEDKINSTLTDFGFPKDEAHRYSLPIEKLSNGEAKLVNICTELLISSGKRLLLLDEPTSGLDLHNEAVVMEQLRTWSEDKKQAIIVVVHTLNCLGQCARVLFIANRKLKGEGIGGHSEYTAEDDVLRKILDDKTVEGLKDPLANRYWFWVRAYKEYKTEPPAHADPIDSIKKSAKRLCNAVSSPESRKVTLERSIDSIGRSTNRLWDGLRNAVSSPESRKATFNRSIDSIAKSTNRLRGSLQNAALSPESLKATAKRFGKRLQGRKINTVTFSVDEFKHQTWVLLRRNWRVLRNDGPAIPLWTGQFLPLRLFFLMGLALITGFFLIGVLPNEAYIRSECPPGVLNCSDSDMTDLRQAVFFLALSVAVLGLIGSYREIAKEIIIYRYERLKGLNPGAYLLAKWLLLVLLLAVITPCIVEVVLLLEQPIAPQGVLVSGAIELLTILLLSSIAAVSLGLAISVWGSSGEMATAGVALAIVVNALLAGLVKNNLGAAIIGPLSSLAITRWSMEGITTILRVYCWTDRGNANLTDHPSFGHLSAITLWLGAYTLGAIAVALIGLFVQDRWCSVGERLRHALNPVRESTDGYTSHAQSIWRRIIDSLNPFTAWIFIVVTAGLLLWGQALHAVSARYYSPGTDAPPNIVLRGIGQARCPITPMPTPITTTTTMYEPTFTPMPGTLRSSTATPSSYEPTFTPMPGTPKSSTATPSSVATMTATRVARATDTPTAAPTQSCLSLPCGQLLAQTELRYRPDGTVLATASQGDGWILLGKAASGRWFLVRMDTGTSRGKIGWVLSTAVQTSAGKLAERTNEVRPPPECARPVAFSGQGVEGGDPASGLVGQWRSSLNGTAVFVIYVHHQSSEAWAPNALVASVNGKERKDKEVKTPATRQMFLLRAEPVELSIAQGDAVRLGFQNMPGTFESFVVVFEVPRNCKF